MEELIQKAEQETPIFDFVSPDGIGHKGYPISDPETIRRLEHFQGISKIYIADGHHRAASAVKVGLKRRKEHPGYTGEEPFNWFFKRSVSG